MLAAGCPTGVAHAGNPPLRITCNPHPVVMASESTDGRDSGPHDAAALLQQLHTELQRLAAARMAKERPGHTLSATALVNEAWLRIGRDRPDGWASRAQFFAAAAEAMRRVLIDHARARGRLRRGGGQQPVGWTELELPAPDDSERILALTDAVEAFTAVDPRAAGVVRLRLFAGLGEAEVAEITGDSERTVRRDWQFARAWLFQRLGGSGD